MSIFALILNGSISTEEIKYFLNARDEVADWIQANPVLVLIKAEHDSNTFAKSVNAYLKKNKPDSNRSAIAIRLEKFTLNAGDIAGRPFGSMAKVAWDRYAEWSGVTIDWGEAAPKPAVAKRLPSRE